MVVNHGQIGHIWEKNRVKLRILELEGSVLDSVKSGDFRELSWAQKCLLKRVLQPVCSEKQPWNHGRIDNSHQNIVKLGIFQILSFIFESGEIRRFQGAFMSPKTSVKTCSTVD